MIGRCSISFSFAIFVLSILMGAGSDRRKPAPKITPAQLDCGPIAVYTLLQIEGRPTPIESITTRLPPARPGGYSMKELRDSALSLGLKLDGVYIGKDPEAIDRPMLVFLKLDRKGHFLVICPVGHTGKLVQVIDSIHPTRVMEKADLVASDQWTGVVLLPRRTNWSIFAAGSLLASTCLGGLAFFFIRGRHLEDRDRATPQSPV